MMAPVSSRGRRWEWKWAQETLGHDSPNLWWESEFLLRLLASTYEKLVPERYLMF